LLIKRGKAIKVPVAAKILVAMKTIRAWIILFLNHPLNDAHSTKERLSISSTEKMSLFLRHLLTAL
jgi:di/tripeptidase